MPINVSINPETQGEPEILDDVIRNEAVIADGARAGKPGQVLRVATNASQSKFESSSLSLSVDQTRLRDLTDLPAFQGAAAEGQTDVKLAFDKPGQAQPVLEKLGLGELSDQVSAVRGTVRDGKLNLTLDFKMGVNPDLGADGKIFKQAIDAGASLHTELDGHVSMLAGDDIRAGVSSHTGSALRTAADPMGKTPNFGPNAMTENMRIKAGVASIANPASVTPDKPAIDIWAGNEHGFINIEPQGRDLTAWAGQQQRVAESLRQQGIGATFTADNDGARSLLSQYQQDLDAGKMSVADVQRELKLHAYGIEVPGSDMAKLPEAMGKAGIVPPAQTESLGKAVELHVGRYAPPEPAMVPLDSTGMWQAGPKTDVSAGQARQAEQLAAQRARQASVSTDGMKPQTFQWERPASTQSVGGTTDTGPSSGRSTASVSTEGMQPQTLEVGQGRTEMRATSQAKPEVAEVSPRTKDSAAKFVSREPVTAMPAAANDVAAIRPVGEAPRGASLPTPANDVAPHLSSEPLERPAGVGGKAAGVAGLALAAYGAYEEVHRRAPGTSVAGALGEMPVHMAQGLISTYLKPGEEFDKGNYGRAAGATVTAVTQGLVDVNSWGDNLSAHEKAIPADKIKQLDEAFRSHQDKTIIPHNVDPYLERIDYLMKAQARGETRAIMSRNPLNGDRTVWSIAESDKYLPLVSENVPIGDAIHYMERMAAAKGLGAEAVEVGYDNNAYNNRRADAVLMKMPDLSLGGSIYMGIYKELRDVQGAVNERNHLLKTDPQGDPARWQHCRDLALKFLDNVDGASPAMADREVNGDALTIARPETFAQAGLASTMKLNGDAQHDLGQIKNYIADHQIDVNKQGSDGIFDAGDLLAQLPPDVKKQVQAARTQMAQTGVAPTAPATADGPPHYGKPPAPTAGAQR